jgi:hypothetical protein
MLVTSTMNCSATSGHVQAEVARLRSTTEASLRARIERGRRAGELPRGADVTGLTRYFATVVQGMTVQARDGVSRRALLATVKLAMAAWPA